MNDLDRLPLGVTLTPHFGTCFRIALRVTRCGLTVGYVWLAHARRARRPIRWEYGRVLSARGVGHRHTRWRAAAAMLRQAQAETPE